VSQPNSKVEGRRPLESVGKALVGVGASVSTSVGVVGTRPKGVGTADSWWSSTSHTRISFRRASASCNRLNFLASYSQMV
jgi:hypothetical protein